MSNIRQDPLQGIVALQFLKLGGALITDKNQPHKVRQETLERLGIVMLLVAGAADEGDAPLEGRVQKLLPCVAVSLKFSKVAMLEFIPFGGVMPEPLTQFIAGRYILEPSVHPQAFFLHSPGPQALHQKSFSIAGIRRIIDPLDLYHLLVP